MSKIDRLNPEFFANSGQESIQSQDINELHDRHYKEVAKFVWDKKYGVPSPNLEGPVRALVRRVDGPGSSPQAKTIPKASELGGAIASLGGDVDSMKAHIIRAEVFPIGNIPSSAAYTGHAADAIDLFAFEFYCFGKPPAVNQVILVDFQKKLYIEPVVNASGDPLMLSIEAPPSTKESAKNTDPGLGQMDDKGNFSPPPTNPPTQMSSPPMPQIEPVDDKDNSIEISQVDYPYINKGGFDIMPGISGDFEKKYQAEIPLSWPMFTPLKKRLKTRLIVIKETSLPQTQPFRNTYNGNDVDVTHYSISHNSRKNGTTDNFLPHEARCTIRVNTPFGVALQSRDDDSGRGSVYCQVSNPVNVGSWLAKKGDWSKASVAAAVTAIVDQKYMPDGSEAFILGPNGTPGLLNDRYTTSDTNDTSLIGHYKSAPGLRTDDELMFVQGGHYVLPTERQAQALWTLVSSLIEKPPYTKNSRISRFHQNGLMWDFPALGRGDFGKIIVNSKEYEAFTWGPVNPYTKNFDASDLSIETKKKKLQFSLEHKRMLPITNRNLKRKIGKAWFRGEEKMSGVVSQHRWGGMGSCFLEYYLLARAYPKRDGIAIDSAAHSEAWYCALAAASLAVKNPFKLGKKSIFTTGYSTVLPVTPFRMELIDIGSKMWIQSTRYIRGENE